MDLYKLELREDMPGGFTANPGHTYLPAMVQYLQGQVGKVRTIDGWKTSLGLFLEHANNSGIEPDQDRDIREGLQLRDGEVFCWTGGPAAKCSFGSLERVTEEAAQRK